MRRMLSRLFGRRGIEAELGLEVAREDWAPPPPSETGTDWGQWLQTEEAKPPPVPAALTVDSEPDQPAAPPPEAPTKPIRPERSRRAPRPRIRTLPGERRWRDVLTAFAEHLTDEELLIIKKQMAG
jgi:hypothetical protein